MSACVNMLYWFYANLKDKRMSARAGGIGRMCLSVVRMGQLETFCGYIRASGRGERRSGLLVSGFSSSVQHVVVSSELLEEPAVDVM